MRQRLAALVCAVVMLVQLSPPSARAAESIYFMSVDETLLEVTDATMPFWSGGYLFVPASLFSARELGLSFSYNRLKKTAVIWANGQQGRALIFDLAGDLVWDGAKENNYSPPAIVRSSGVFVAVSMVAAYFGLTYTNTKVAHGYLVRIRGSNSVLSDADFIDAGASQFYSRYTKYIKAKEPSAGSSGTVSGAGTGTGTAVEPEPSVGGGSAALCIRAPEKPEDLGALLDALGGENGITVYFTARQLGESGDLLRRMLAMGCAVGLTADAGLDQPVRRQLQSANAALWAAAGIKTRLCLVDNASAQTLAAAAADGYCCLQPDLDRSREGLRGASGARALLSGVNARRGTVSVWLDGSVTAAGLSALRTAAARGSDRLTAMTETTDLSA